MHTFLGCHGVTPSDMILQEMTRYKPQCHIVAFCKLTLTLKFFNLNNWVLMKKN